MDSDSYSSYEEDDSDSEPPGPQFATSTAHKGTQLSASSLSLGLSFWLLLCAKPTSGIGVITCTELSIVIACGRCRTQAQTRVRAQEKSAGTIAQAFIFNLQVECSKCHCVMSVNFRPELMHEASFVLGYIDPDV